MLNFDMLSFDEFSKQDFYTTVNHMQQFSHIKSKLISGSPSYKPISIVIPTYKRSHLLREALMSCLEQTYNNFNVIIADNNPEEEDETELLIRELDDQRIVYYKNEENIGPLANFNRCIELADSKYCVFLCSDDLLDIKLLERVMLITDKKPSIDMLLPEKDIMYSHKTYKMRGYSTYLRIASKIMKRPLALRLNPADFMLYYPAGGPSGIIYLKDAFMESGGFNPQWHPTGDNVLHIFLTTFKEVYLTTVDSGDYRMLENISSEKEMSNIYLIQNYLFRKEFVRKHDGYRWVDNYYKGNIYYRLKMDRFGKFNVSDVEKVVGKCNVFQYLFFLSVWLFHYIKLPFRIRRW